MWRARFDAGHVDELRLASSCAAWRCCPPTLPLAILRRLPVGLSLSLAVSFPIPPQTKEHEDTIRPPEAKAHEDTIRPKKTEAPQDNIQFAGLIEGKSQALGRLVSRRDSDR